VSDRRHPNHREARTLPPELRRTTVPPAVRAWAERAVGTQVVAVTRLAGASTTAVHRLRFADGTSLVLRRYVWPFVLEDEPITPRRELDALAFANSHGLPVPHLVAADISGKEIGDGVPALLMTHLPGRATSDPDVVRLAEVAATIHGVGAGDFAHEYLPWFADEPTRPATARRPELWERALELRTTARPQYRTTFIHRDFHPGNVLWLRGRCSGVVDWAEACRGPAGCDVATCRGDLIGLCGVEVAERFRHAYEATTGEIHHPYWDLARVLEHGPSPWTQAEVTQAEWCLADALGRLERMT
jgi:aminoglycoside phosphotransferase (APT) family kinase protein